MNDLESIFEFVKKRKEPKDKYKREAEHLNLEYEKILRSFEINRNGEFI